VLGASKLRTSSQPKRLKFQRPPNALTDIKVNTLIK
jgi:hypothetical protein